MNKNFAIALLIGVPLLHNAQNVQIKWAGSVVVDYGFVKKTFPKFSNDGYGTDGKNVYIDYKISGNANVKAVNASWQPVSMSEIGDLNPFQLPQGEVSAVSASGNSTATGNGSVLHVAAFKFDGTRVYRLSSFDVQEVPSSASARRDLPSKLGTTANPLANGVFYKIKIDKSGIFKITTKFLSDIGLKPSDVDPRNLRIYGNGGVMLPEIPDDPRYAALQENAVQVIGEEDGRWDAGDYALFYAQGPNGFNLYQNTTGGTQRTENREDNALHVQNVYDDNAYYFLNFDQGPGKRVLKEDTAIPAEMISTYDDYQAVDDEKINLLKIGKVWVGDAFTGTKTVNFSTRTPLQASDRIYYRASVVGYNAQNNIVRFNINGQQNYATTVPNTPDAFSKINTFKGTVSGLSGNSIAINITADLTANPAGGLYFDYAEVMYPQELQFNGTQMNFRKYSIAPGSGQQVGFVMSNAAAAEQVWDVSDPTNAKFKVNNASLAGTYSFGYSASDPFFNNEFVAFNSASAYSPAFVGKIGNQDLHSLSNVDYLIITQPEMFGEAKRLAAYHQQKNKFHVEIVDVGQIYNEFSSGRRDVTAIRDFAAYLHNERGGLRYMLILGDASFDVRNRTLGNDNIVPSYESEDSGSFTSSFVTDDYFAMVNKGASPLLYYNTPAFAVGRLPASNVTEAKLLVDKTLAYYNALPGQSSPFGLWRMKLDFVVDDDADGGEPFHNVVNQNIADNFEKDQRTEYNISKLYLDAAEPVITSAGQRYPQINDAISNDMGNSLFMFYFGHGGITGWAQERVYNDEEIRKFNNYNAAYSHFPFVSTITCEFTLWDNPFVVSAGEQTVKHKNGGAAAMITSSRALGVDYGKKFSKTYLHNIFELNNAGQFNTLGEAFLKSKVQFGGHPDHLKVNLLGDPAMQLSRPLPNLTIDKVESPDSEKLRALDFVKISGQVKKPTGEIDTSFNGRVSVNVFDKRLQKKTRNNDNNPQMLPLLDYSEEGSAVVKASGKAVNGQYTVQFYVPKDINFSDGNGRILAYADNFETAKSEAYDVFAQKIIKIGGINPNGITDSTPPKISLFMNNTNFADGGITSQNPLLLACITDDTGINSTGSGIGHDITVVLDGEVVNTAVLNDFFTAGETNGCFSGSLEEYQKGSVAYPLRNLSPGKHQLVLKVWDINNNFSTAALNFTVKDESEQKLTINRPLNWPNPFTDRTFIQFEHNCDDILNVNVQIYTITGRLVRTLSQQVTTEVFRQGFRTPAKAIEWDGTDDYGATVGKGTYIFKILARSENQDKCKGAATAMEKMVLLK